MINNGLWPQLMAFTKEPEGSFERRPGQLQDVRTLFPKEPEIARSAESFCPQTML